MLTIPFNTFRLKQKIFIINNLFQTSISAMNKSAQKQSHTKVAVPKQFVECSPTSKFDVLPSPTKSFSDKKEYKVIRLENGLTACLISDLRNNLDVSSVLSQESDSESEAGSIVSEGEESEAESVKATTDDEEGNDGVKMKKEHDDVKLAATALCIGVGSFSDPIEVPGLAHFLEHMVFMGSEKFPQENDFDAYIKKHGGSDNASTDYEVTTFYFECFEKHLYMSMNKFAQFFISPLMKKESMTREREAVESEFQMALPSDDYRKEQLLLSFAEDSSPVKSFSWGNLVTLKDNISDDKLYEMLHEFRRRHYSAHRMTLAVQARLPIDMLESYVVDCFSNVPNNKLPPIDFKSYSENIFNTPAFNKLYYVKPVKDICQIELTWVMPSLQHMYKSKPHVYVSWLLGHEGKGSLLSYLKKKVWALSLYAGNGESGAEFNSLYSSFSVNIILTKEGFAHIKEVIEAMYGYLNLLKTLGPEERIFKEIQLIEETSFRFEEEESACDKVEELVESMQNYPPEDYLTGSDLFFVYDPEAIKMVLNYLVPHKMNILILSSRIPATINYDKIEPWFKTPYTDMDIPSDWIECWLKAESLTDFAMPEPNRYLTEDFSLLPTLKNIPEYPEKILQTPLIELWYRKDQKFNLPMAYYYYYLITSHSLESAQSSCMMMLYVTFVNIHLAENGYAAKLAELLYTISACEKGVCLKVAGYNEKLPMLINLIIECINTVGNIVTEEVFEAVKERQTKAFYNGFLKPSKLCKDMRLSILQNKYYSLLDRHTAMSGITYHMMIEFIQNIFQNLFIQGLVQGNLTDAAALETTNKLLVGLHCAPLSTECYPKITVNEIPKGEYCCRVMSFNKDNSNSIVTNYYQCGLLTIKTNIILEYIMLLIEEPLFDILRTKEQLGYSVYGTIRDTYGILGYTITVNLQANKFTTQYVDARIEAFLKHSNKLLKRMTDKKFIQTKKDLIKMKQCIDVDLEDEVDRNWEEIVHGVYLFDRKFREIEAINDVRVGEVRKWWEQHNIFGKKDEFKKLSVQIVGHATCEGIDNLLNVVDESSVTPVVTTSEVKEVSMDTQDEFKIILLQDAEEIIKNSKKDEYFINNIESFKKQLLTYAESTKMDIFK